MALACVVDGLSDTEGAILDVLAAALSTGRAVKMDRAAAAALVLRVALARYCLLTTHHADSFERNNHAHRKAAHGWITTDAHRLNVSLT